MTNDTNGRRIYAIGDIHGCIDQLQAMQDNIAQDLRTRPHAHPVIVYIGDFADRGVDSKGVIQNLMSEEVAAHETYFLRGNHDQIFLNYLDDPDSRYITQFHWLDKIMGGRETLASYGVTFSEGHDTAKTHAAFVAAVPDAHVEFLNRLILKVKIGSYVFVHAGIRPGVPLDEQVVDDLVWIRKPFLTSTLDHGFTVVHGHTVVSTVENHGNRIGIDTGAVFKGTLSCLVLEDGAQNLLTADGLVPCPVLKG